MSSQQQSPAIHETERYHFPDHDIPGESRASGLDGLGLKLPVTDLDGKITLDSRLLVGQLPEGISHEDSEQGEATVLERPDLSDEDRTESDLQEIWAMFDHVEEPIARHVLDEFNAYLYDMTIDELEDLEPGQFIPLADIEIIGKRSEKWLCSDFEVSVYTEPGNVIELDAGYF